VFHTYAEEHHLYQNLPNLKIIKIQGKSPIITIGPDIKSESSYGFGDSVCTLPGKPGPTTDSFILQAYTNGSIYCIAGGCGLDEASREASNIAKDTFIATLNKKLNEIKTVKDAGVQLISALAAAHEKIVSLDTKNKNGTTTLLGGLLVEIDDKKEHDWAFVAVSVGNCKAFHFSVNGQIQDFTAENLLVGDELAVGKIGPCINGKDPDLRNIRLTYVSCKENDIIMLVSDGVHYNLDPKFLGKVPKDLGLGPLGWEELNPIMSSKVQKQFMEDTLANIIDVKNAGASVEPNVITKRILDYCLNVTSKSRDWVEKHPGKPLDTDFTKFPGVLDYSTCLSFKVGRYDPEVEQSTKSRRQTPLVAPENIIDVAN